MDGLNSLGKNKDMEFERRIREAMTAERADADSATVHFAASDGIMTLAFKRDGAHAVLVAHDHPSKRHPNRTELRYATEIARTAMHEHREAEKNALLAREERIADAILRGEIIG